MKTHAWRQWGRRAVWVTLGVGTLALFWALLLPPMRWYRWLALLLSAEFGALLLVSLEYRARLRSRQTLQRRMEEQARALRREQDRLHLLLDDLFEGIILTDHQGRVRMLNRAARHMLGLPMSNNVEGTLAQVVGHHQIIDMWQRCRKAAAVPPEEVHLRRTGRRLKVHMRPLSNGECVVLLLDVTERYRVEAMRRDFISNISHELRTPLASLKILADTIREVMEETPQAIPEFVDRMDREIDTLVQLVEELLELSRIESGQVPLHLEPVSLADVILPPVERLRPQVERAGLTLHVDVPQPGPPVLADAERLPRVVTNLVHNAIKFTPPGGHIILFAREEEQEVVVGVRDTGIGIPREALPRIFERFYKIDRSRRERGTGLGLSIARHLVEAHGGRIWVESEEGRGSTFYFTLKKHPS